MKIEKENIPVDGSMHGVTEHGEARRHGGEEASRVLILLRATHFRSNFVSNPNNQGSSSTKTKPI